MDVYSDGFKLGGTASFAAKVAKALGYEVTVLTSFGPDFEFVTGFEEIRLINIEADKTTIFENTYTENGRTQILHNKAKNLMITDCINEKFDIIHFCPIADEIDFALVDALIHKCTLSLTTPQGWMRQWKEDKKVFYKPIDWKLLSQIDFTIISDEDVPNLTDEIKNIQSSISKLIVTKGKNGASLYLDGIEKSYPAHPTKVKDTTGAGDTFAIAFISSYLKSRDFDFAMNYANGLAALCVGSDDWRFLKKINTVK